MSDSKYKTLYYKKAIFEPAQTKTLQSMLTSALKKKQMVKDRFMTTGSGNDTHYFINENHSKDGMIFGSMCLFTEGAWQPIVDVTSLNQETLPVSALPPDRSDKHVREYIESMLFFGVFRNHVAVLQSQSISSQKFELYINWFLREVTKSLRDGSAVYLTDQVSPKKLKKLKGVKSLNLTAPVKMSPETTKTGGEEKIQFVPKGKAWDALKTLLREANFPESIQTSKAFDADRIEVDMKLKWVGRQPGDETPILDTVANTLRHVDDLDYLIDLGGKRGTISRDEVKLYKKFSVPYVDGVADSSVVYRNMKEWIEELGQEQRIID